MRISFCKIFFLNYLLICAKSDEPHCSKYDFEEKVLEKMVRMEFQMERMKSEIEQTVKSADRKLNEMDEKMEALPNKTVESVDRKLQEMDEEMEALQNKTVERVDRKLNEMDAKEAKGNIAFTAHFEVKDEYVPPDSTIVFPTCTLNEGNGYDNETGDFTVPLAGVYTFTAHICNAVGKYMVFAIAKNSDLLAISSTFENSGSVCGSVTTIVKLQEGDVVNVVAKFEYSYILANEYRWNSFSGYLVFA